MNFENINEEIVICIFGCASIEKYKLQIYIIEETWGKEAAKMGIRYLFFLSENDKKANLKGEHYIYLKGVDDSYASASHKQNLGLKYIYENIPNFKYVYCCGTDTYINIKNLIKFIKTNNDLQKYKDTQLIIGGHSNIISVNNVKFTFFYGGAGFILNKNSITQLYPLLYILYELWGVICKNNINLINACDVCICYFSYIFKFKMLKYYTLFLDCDWNGFKTNTYTDEFHRFYVCCSPNVNKNKIISCHNMSIQMFCDYTLFLQCNQTENTQPENTQPENIQPENTQPENTQPENTQPKNTQIANFVKSSL